MRISDDRSISVFFSFFLVIAVIQSCRNSPNETRKSSAGNEVLSAERLSIERFDGYTRVTVFNPWQGQQNIAMEYYLVRSGAAIPEGIDSANVIFVPVHKMVCMSVTHSAMIEALGCGDCIIGQSGINLVWSPSLKLKIQERKIPEVGYDSGINTELIMKLSPDVLIMYGIGNESAGYVNKLKDAGVKLVYDADYLENTPLGKAEWIRLFGALLCRDEAADSIYTSEAELYNHKAEIIRNETGTRPEVLLGFPYKGTWYISPGNSYISRLISDAGGSYLWEDTRSERSMPYGIENVFTRAIKADFWLNPGIAESKRDIAAVDSRLADLPCYAGDNIYNNIKRLNSSGGNDYWENGAVHPSMLLQDISEILHPGLSPDSSLVFYKKLK
ncbi:MAG TPA: ABC transporter substrate-binding protein [Bacteroidales bacterium]|nr:ABC transporter substrate-binding protein [Bacteroidales bacterium]